MSQRLRCCHRCTDGPSLGTSKLASHVGFFQELVTHDPNISLFELRDALTGAKDVTVYQLAAAGLLRRMPS